MIGNRRQESPRPPTLRLLALLAVASIGAIAAAPAGLAAPSWPTATSARSAQSVPPSVTDQSVTVQSVSTNSLGGLGSGSAAECTSATPIFANTLSLGLDSVTPAVTTAQAGNRLILRGSVTNTATTAVTGLIYRFQRGDRLASGAELNTQLDTPCEPTAVLADDWNPLAEEIPAGGSIGFAVGTAVAGQAAGSLQVDKPGVYPVMVNVNGTIDTEDGPTEVRLGELHLMVTVTSVPGVAAGKPATPAAPVPIGMLWPIVSRPHLGVGNVFIDDSLASDIAPGGALANRLDALEAAGLPADTVIGVIDPMLLDELDKMSRGYLVVAEGSAEPPITMAPTGSAASTLSTSVTTAAPPAAPSGSTPNPPTTGTGIEFGLVPPENAKPGTGAEAAAAFLTRLRTFAQQHQLVVLPYSNPDAVAITRAKVDNSLRDLAKVGREVTKLVLGDSPTILTNVGLPPDGLTDADTLAAYAAAGYTTLLLDNGSVQSTGTADGLATISAAPRTKRTFPALVDDADAVESLFTAVLNPAPTGRPGGSLNAAVAVVAQRSIDGDGRPLLRLPDDVIDTAGLTDLGNALTALQADHAVTGLNLRTQLAAARTQGETATVTFPASAESALLPNDYLSRIAGLRANLGSLRQGLTDPNNAAQPGIYLAERLIAAQQSLTSVSLRTDRQPALTVLGTVDGTIDYLHQGLSIITTAGSYTLASADSPLVLTVQNSLPYSANVMLRLSGGEDVGFSATVPASVLVPAGATRQVEIKATALRAGTFVLRVLIVGPDGRTWAQPVQLRIRSNAYAALTIVLIAVAGGILFLMVALRIWQRWRARKVRLADEAAGRDKPQQSGPAPDSITGSSATEPEYDGPSEQSGRIEPDNEQADATAPARPIRPAQPRVPDQRGWSARQRTVPVDGPTLPMGADLPTAPRPQPGQALPQDERRKP